MPSKSQIKLIRSLHLKKYRIEHGLFVVEGSTNVLELLSSKLEPVWLFACAPWFERFPDKARQFGFEQVTGKEMEMMSQLKNPSEVLAVFKLLAQPKPEDIKINDLTLVLDDIKDPGNLGTIIRTADWFGVKQVVCSLETVDAFNPKVVQATMGSLARVLVYHTELVDFFETMDKGVSVYGALLKGTDVRKIQKRKPAVLVIGSEAHGIRKNLLPYLQEKITILHTGTSGAESLNASIATAILCYEFRR